MNDLSPERLAELIEEARQIARTEPQHEWDRRALEWPLTSESVVVEIGGYKGRWALQIAERYNPQLYVFEPQTWAADVCKGVLEGYNARVYRYGLSLGYELRAMSRWGTDGCSFVDVSYLVPSLDVGETRDAAIALGNIGHIDLLMMNIEGYEYTLLPYMLDKGILPDRLMVQFHSFADPDDSKLKTIKRRMKKHYTVAWDYGITLMAWERKRTV